jgi:hypothetical protein
MRYCPTVKRLNAIKAIVEICDNTYMHVKYTIPIKIEDCGFPEEPTNLLDTLDPILQFRTGEALKNELVREQTE